MEVEGEMKNMLSQHRDMLPNPTSTTPWGHMKTPPQKRLNISADSDSDATVKITDEELSVRTGSPRPSPSVQSLLVENSPRWVSSSIQTLIMKSIDWKELRHAVRDDIVGVVNEEILKDDVRIRVEHAVMKYSNIENIDLTSIPTGGVIDRERLSKTVALVAKRAVFKTICFKALSKDIVEHILNAMDLESLKARAIEKIVRNTTPVSQLEQMMVCVSNDMDM
jgi:hypothetical protein